MKLEIPFKQSDLIFATGSQFPKGICLGLVIQWLISNSKYIGDNESQFWIDLKASNKHSENAPLLGVGYAAKANKFHKAVSGPNPERNEIDLTKELLENEGILFSKISNGGHHSPFDNTRTIDIKKKLFEADEKYKIVIIEGKDLKGKYWGHAIGIYRPTSILGNPIHVFDPNVGKYICDGADDAFDAFQDISATIAYTNVEQYFSYLFN